MSLYLIYALLHLFSPRLYWTISQNEKEIHRNKTKLKIKKELLLPLTTPNNQVLLIVRSLIAILAPLRRIEGTPFQSKPPTMPPVKLNIGYSLVARPIQQDQKEDYIYVTIQPANNLGGNEKNHFGWWGGENEMEI